MGTFFSNYWTDFVGRLDGPLHFRLFVQPMMAIFFAVRDGSREAVRTALAGGTRAIGHH